MGADAVNIIIPLLNQLPFTRRCLAGLRQETDGPFRAILVDNGSTDGTREYLATVAGAEVIVNERNVGVAAAWNQGVRLARGRWTVILNNDTVLPGGWLRRLVSFCEREHVQVASPSMREGELNYDPEGYAEEFVRSMGGRKRMGVADGACFVVERKVFDEIGAFDERFFPGAYEDADFFRRAKNAGFRLAVTGSSFIHHFGFTTQREMSEEKMPRHVLENRERYCSKWGLSHPDGNWFEKRWNRLRGAWHRNVERRSCGHTVKERWVGGRIVYR